MKLCPQCNTKCLNSATACDCGFSFLGESPAVAAVVSVPTPQPAVTHRKYSGVKGWLLVLVIQLAILIPARSAMSLLALQGAPSLQAMRELGADLTDADQILRAVNDARFTTKTEEIYRRDGYIFRQIDQVVFGLAAFLTGIQILRREPAAYGFMRFFVMSSFITGLLVLFLSHGGLWPQTVIPFVMFCVWAIVWWFYFERSKRVKQTLT
jgi:hypothetical protein